MPDSMNMIPLTVLADRIRSAYAQTENATEEWIEGTLKLAAALAEARGRFPADRDFSVWLAQNDLDCVTHQDRAALINMAADLRIAREVLQETRSKSWRLIWTDEMSSRFTSTGKPDLPAPTAANPPPAQPPAENPPAESADSKPASQPEPPAAKVSKRSPFYGLLRADEVSAIYTNTDGRTTIGKAVQERGGKDLWALILQALDAKLLTPTNLEFATVTLRVIFPWAPRGYCNEHELTNAKARKYVREHILPAAIAKRDALLAAPEKIKDLIADYWRERQNEALEAAKQQRVADALQTMPANQREVTMFGVRLWPRTEIKYGTYDYEQICAAIWYFKDFDAWMQGRARNDPAERAIIIRFSTKWPLVYLARAFQDKPDERQKMEKVYQAICMLSNLLEANPHGECVTPPTPKVEGQW